MNNPELFFLRTAIILSYKGYILRFEHFMLGGSLPPCRALQSFNAH